MRVGQRIREKYSNCEGTVVLVRPGHILVEWDNGLKDIVHVNYMKHITLIEGGKENDRGTVEGN